jgi:hypothetical protein
MEVSAAGSRSFNMHKMHDALRARYKPLCQDKFLDFCRKLETELAAVVAVATPTTLK